MLNLDGLLQNRKIVAIWNKTQPKLRKLSQLFLDLRTLYQGTYIFFLLKRNQFAKFLETPFYRKKLVYFIQHPKSLTRFLKSNSDFSSADSMKR